MEEALLQPMDKLIIVLSLLLVLEVYCAIYILYYIYNAPFWKHNIRLQGTQSMNFDQQTIVVYYVNIVCSFIKSEIV